MDKGKSLKLPDNKEDKLYFRLKLKFSPVSIQYFKLLIATFILALVITDNTRLSCWRLNGISSDILIDCKKCSHSLRLTVGLRSFVRRKRFYTFLICWEKFIGKILFAFPVLSFHCITLILLLHSLHFHFKRFFLNILRKCG